MPRCRECRHEQSRYMGDGLVAYRCEVHDCWIDLDGEACSDYAKPRTPRHSWNRGQDSGQYERRSYRMAQR